MTQRGLERRVRSEEAKPQEQRHVTGAGYSWGQGMDKERLPGTCGGSDLTASADVDVRGCEHRDIGKGELGLGRGVSQSCWGGCTGHTGTECPGKPKLGQRKAQSAGQRAWEKINCLVFHKSEEFGVSIWGFPFPGRGGVSHSSPLTPPPHPTPTPPHPLTPPPPLSSDVPDTRELRERGDPQAQPL